MLKCGIGEHLSTGVKLLNKSRRGTDVSSSERPETLTVLYDGECPLCQREIAYAKGLAGKAGDSALCFVDINRGANADTTLDADRATLLARFHVQRADGSRLDGAAAFVAMWSRLPGWRWLARLAHLPGVLMLLESAYCVFLHVRPWAQKLVRYCSSLR